MPDNRRAGSSSLGMVSEVTPREKMIQRSMEIASEIAKQPARILCLAKRLFYLSQGKSLEEMTELSASHQTLCHHTLEHMAALEAFFAKQRGR